jgi:hypothetical protein
VEQLQQELACVRDIQKECTCTYIRFICNLLYGCLIEPLPRKELVACSEDSPHLVCLTPLSSGGRIPYRIVLF